MLVVCSNFKNCKGNCIYRHPIEEKHGVTIIALPIEKIFWCGFSYFEDNEVIISKNCMTEYVKYMKQKSIRQSYFKR
jgi:hypothetical protein